MALAFKEPRQRSSITEANSTHSPTLDASTSNAGGASDLEKVIGAHVVDQETLERDVALEASRAINEREDELDHRRLEKAQNGKDKLLYQLQSLCHKLEKRATKLEERERIQEQIEVLNRRIVGFDHDIQDINERINERSQVDPDIAISLASGSNARMPNETQREFLIRTGKITPFAKLLVDGDDDDGSNNEIILPSINMSHQNLRMPGFGPECEILEEDQVASHSKKRRRLTRFAEPSGKIEPSEDDEGSDAEYTLPQKDESEDIYSEPSADSDYDAADNKRRAKSEDKKEAFALADDGNERQYQARLRRWMQGRKNAREREYITAQQEVPEGIEWTLPHPTVPDHIENGYRMPGDIYPSLFDYQKTCVQWLWELHQQNVGGIIGDEMGLGKTIQIISFLAGLHYSGKLTKPVLVVAPATVLKQWVNEFHKWWPPLRVPILHSSGSGMLDVNNEEDMEGILEFVHEPVVNNKHGPAAKKLVNRIFEKGHVLVTTYAGIQTYGPLLLEREWGYAILDEGHKIRNPDARVSLACKQLKTTHRIILSGTPMQNNLTELWSLFDFIYPGRLGVLPVFQSSFAVPIRIGGYANATNVQIQTSYQCACALRDLIGPYLLRRLKVDVAADLPKKVEQVLFCKLTAVQRDYYEKFLRSNELKSIMEGKRQVLYGVDILRKICNHPDLVDRDKLIHKEGYQYGKGNKSGKMQVVKALLELWKGEGHRTLLFSQTRQMLDILEAFVKKIGHYKYLRMDGMTAINHRQQLVDRFNDISEIDLFLLTTKVGGLGVNLTGADRVIIFDPDWNPSTDMQARERSWRLGQKKAVTIYRLMTAGTIEEKIYHRQIFKQFLTNKILQDPKQRQSFKMNDLHDLFTLGSDLTGGTETGNMFRGAEKAYANNREGGDDPDKLVRLGGVAGLASFTSPGDEDNTTHNEGESEVAEKSDDMRVLEGILGKSGVHSTLEHDTIMESSRPADVAVQKEVKKIVDAAAATLNASRKMAMKAEIGIPTWTGKKGSAGKAGNVGKGDGNSSASGSSSGGSIPYRRLKGDDRWLYPMGGSSSSPNNHNHTPLRNTADRSQRCTNTNRRRTVQTLHFAPDQPMAAPAASRITAQHNFVDKLREYLLERGGQATNNELLKAFEQEMMKEGIGAEAFKALLREVAIYWDRTRTWKVKNSAASGSPVGGRTASNMDSTASDRRR